MDLNLKPGEKYAGIILGKGNAPDHRLILLPGDNDATTWEDQMEWAKSIGGELPTRREQALLYANLGEEFEGDAYWSCEDAESGWAWGQNFSYGIQIITRKDGALRARAVRRLVIE